MKKILGISLLLSIVLLPRISYSNCHNILKLEVQKRLNLNHHLFSSKFFAYEQFNDVILEESLNKYPTKANMIQNKSLKNSKSFISALESQLLPEKYEKAFKVLIFNIHDKDFIKSWAKDLFRDIVVELYINANPQAIAEFERDGLLPEMTILKVLLERSIEGGFSGSKDDIRTFDDEIKENEFLKILRQKLYIYDEGFEKDRHGHLTHIFHIDFIIHSLKKDSIDPKLAAEIYSWFGKTEKYKIEKSFYSFITSFSPIDAWSALFDSFENDYTSPEEFGPILKGYFRWKK